MGYNLQGDIVDIGDKVYVYKKIFNLKKHRIDKNMIGTIVDIDFIEHEDALGGEENLFELHIQLPNKEIVNIKDSTRQPFFRKYKFIKIEDLRNVIDRDFPTLANNIDVINSIQ